MTGSVEELLKLICRARLLGMSSTSLHPKSDTSNLSLHQVTPTDLFGFTIIRTSLLC